MINHEIRNIRESKTEELKLRFLFCAHGKMLVFLESKTEELKPDIVINIDFKDIRCESKAEELKQTWVGAHWGFEEGFENLI